MNKKARVIAFYLPQYHPTPENDKFWGKGFTEWTNTAKAKPLFKGHHQPHIPADLGFYDLRMPEIREEQAKLAREAGIEGFCYWHYWFGNGKQFLQEIFADVVESGKPDFPFCVGWANHSWNNKNWVNTPSRQKDYYIAEQTYPGMEDHKAHFYSLLKAFKDQRYLRVDGKLLFYIFAPLDIPYVKEFIRLWQDLAKKEGLSGFYFIALHENGWVADMSDTVKILRENWKHQKLSLFVDAKDKFSQIFQLGFDGINSRGLHIAHYRYNSIFVSLIKNIYRRLMLRLFDWTLVQKYDYKRVSMKMYTDEDRNMNIFPTIIPNWDRSPRAGNRAIIWYNYKPEYFKMQVQKALELIKDKPMDHRILFLMSWNEWGEGNYMEPDLEYGHGYLDALREAIIENNS
jgi:hypothetical protein